MATLVFLLEEPSAQAMLEGILPRLPLPSEVVPRFLVFEGKQDLDKRLERRVRSWRAPGAYFIVIRDKDSGDCQIIKQSLCDKLAAAGRPDSLVRIACHELESFYLGDLSAVETGLDRKGLSKLQEKARYRNPDAISNPAVELSKLVDYQKVAGSRAIATHLDLDGRNRSRSFNVLVDGLRRLITNFSVDETE